MQKLTVSGCFQAGFEIFKKRAWLLVGVSFLVLAISFSLALLRSSYPGTTTLSVAATFIDVVVSVFAVMSFMRFMLSAHDHIEEARFRDAFLPRIPNLYIRFGVLYLLLGILEIIGFFFFIIPGIFLSLIFMFAVYIVIDTGASPLQAMKRSARLTKGHRWKLLFLLLATLGINILGMLILFVGLLVTFPLSVLATIHAYRALEKIAAEV